MNAIENKDKTSIKKQIIPQNNQGIGSKDEWKQQ